MRKIFVALGLFGLLGVTVGATESGAAAFQKAVAPNDVEIGADGKVTVVIFGEFDTNHNYTPLLRTANELVWDLPFVLEKNRITFTFTPPPITGPSLTALVADLWSPYQHSTQSYQFMLYPHGQGPSTEKIKVRMLKTLVPICVGNVHCPTPYTIGHYISLQQAIGGFWNAWDNNAWNSFRETYDVANEQWSGICAENFDGTAPPSEPHIAGFTRNYSATFLSERMNRFEIGDPGSFDKFLINGQVPNPSGTAGASCTTENPATICGNFGQNNVFIPDGNITVLQPRMFLMNGAPFRPIPTENAPRGVVFTHITAKDNFIVLQGARGPGLDGYDESGPLPPNGAPWPPSVQGTIQAPYFDDNPSDPRTPNAFTHEFVHALLRADDVDDLSEVNVALRNGTLGVSNEASGLTRGFKANTWTKIFGNVQSQTVRENCDVAVDGFPGDPDLTE